MKRKCHWLKIENGVSRLENWNAFLSMYYFNSRIVERKAKEKNGKEWPHENWKRNLYHLAPRLHAVILLTNFPISTIKHVRKDKNLLKSTTNLA